ncbi:MAG: hypothetical protein M1825_000177 [Sarcosagium campestre]|nr:MAG: hypothetical protein M1825_000177 [Sarcosagium campestre]
MLTRKQYNQKISAFINKYEDLETQKQFESLVGLTREACEKLMKRMSIKAIVQGRVKKCDSLRGKLELSEENIDDDADDEADADEADAEPTGVDVDFYDRNREFPDIKDYILRRGNIYKHPEMGDLAGVRIGLYFPDDVKKVALEIEKHFRKIHRWGTVKGGRITTQGRNLDPEEHLTIGAWVSPGPDGADEHWEHYGYKSWQVVVEWKKDLPGPLESEDLPNRLKSLRERMPKGFKSLRVELQVGTIVTQAWAEVQHNVIYKKPTDIRNTPTMKRMIDAINGLAITTDIMLRELGRSLEDARKEAEEKHRREKDAPQRMFIIACSENDNETVARLLLDNRVNVNASTSDGSTALHWASQAGHSNTVKQLCLDDRVNVNAKNNIGGTVLHCASEMGFSDVVEQLLRHPKIDVNAQNIIGTALHYASRKGFSNVVEQLLRHPEIDVNAQNINGTALHYASEMGFSDVVEQLLHHPEIDVNAQNIFGTALHYASRKGFSNVVEQLLRHPKIDVNAKGYFGETALDMAFANGHSKVVEQLNGFAIIGRGEEKNSINVGVISS